MLNNPFVLVALVVVGLWLLLGISWVAVLWLVSRRIAKRYEENGIPLPPSMSKAEKTEFVEKPEPRQQQTPQKRIRRTQHRE